MIIEILSILYLYVHMYVKVEMNSVEQTDANI